MVCVQLLSDYFVNLSDLMFVHLLMCLTLNLVVIEKNQVSKLRVRLSCCISLSLLPQFSSFILCDNTMHVKVLYDTDDYLHLKGTISLFAVSVFI